MSTAAETRKTVTVLFCDVTGSTELGERLDPEALRRVLLRYWEEMRVILERHGGTVEKFIGDAVMAVFGVPRSHEDDALRAVRAAAEMRDRLARLNDELAAAWGVRLSSRIGVNTGDVVAGDAAAGHGIVTGDAVNVAKRLEEAAGPGEILIGTGTFALVKAAVKAGPLERFPAKGKAEPVGRFRVDQVDPRADGLLQGPDHPLVGRAAELARLRDAFERSVTERSCRLFTILGDPGLGKSRLARELRVSVGDRATTLTGRCLPYGEGITFWPLAQIVRELEGDEGLSGVLAGTDDAEVVADRIRAAIGAPEAGGGGGETFWAVRKLFEALARRRPLIVVLEDIHWAEPMFLDLIEYVAGWTRDAPVLLLCLARHQLLEQRPGWLSPRPGADSAALAPLSLPEAEALLEGLRGEGELGAAERRRITEAAEGNPLFVEQMAAMVAESGGEPLSIPPTIKALLHERLDRLGPVERSVIERASVVGREFWRGAVVDLTPADARDDVGPALMALVRKELVQPEPADFGREDGFRFRHVLVRDAAYDGIPKEVRAELHDRFASWLERRVRDRAAEYEEIVGYHLEQAHTLRTQLGPLDAAARAAGERAADLLASAGRRALGRADAGAAASLLRRATALPGEGMDRVLLLVDLGTALNGSGDLGGAAHTLDDALRTARSAGDRRGEARALVEQAETALQTWTGALDEIGAIADDAAATLAESGDDGGLARALTLRAEVELVRCRLAASEEAATLALAHARRAGEHRQIPSILSLLARAALTGPTPVPEALERCAAIRRESPGNPALEALLATTEAQLEAMRGRFAEARELSGRSRAILEELGRPLAVAIARTSSGAVELLAGDAAAATAELRAAVETLGAMGARATLSTVAAYLAEALYELGEDDEAERQAAASRDAAFVDDILSQVVWRTASARIQARRGDLDEAERLAREAVSLAEETDELTIAAGAFAALGAVLRAAGRGGDGSAAYSSALRLYERKGNLPRAEALRRSVAEASVGV